MASSYQRTQVYLDPDDHRRLKEQAARRGVSLTTVVREAVDRYVVEDPADVETPLRPDVEAWWSRTLDGVAPGSGGFLAAADALAAAGPPPGYREDNMNPEDIAIGEGLLREHEAHVEAFLARTRNDPP